MIVYTYANCDTCRRAVKWLEAKGIAFEERAIRETPPTVAELKRMLTFQGGELRKLFNTAGRDYREQSIGEKLPAFSTQQALTLLSENGNLVKRPFLIASKAGLVGFNEEVWAQVLTKG